MKLGFPHCLEFKVFNFQGNLVLFDTLTTQSFEISPIIRDVLEYGKVLSEEDCINKLLGSYTREEIIGAINELEDLRSQGYCLGKNEPGAQTFIPDPRPRVDLNHIYLTVVTGCNLRCTYCYADDGSFNQGYKFMSLETAKNCIDFTLNHMSENKRLEITYTGGEPLMNFKVIKDSILYAIDKANHRGITVKGSIFTNATLVTDEIAKFLGSYFEYIKVSIDGEKDVHDKLRPYESGKSSYDNIINGLRILKRHVPPQFIVGNTVVTTLDTDMHGHYSRWEKEGVGLIDMSVPIPYGSSYRQEFDFGDESMDRFLMSYRHLVEKYAEDDSGPKLMHMIRKNEEKKYGCGFGRSTITFDPDGGIYSCPESVAKEVFKIGDIHSGLKALKNEIFVNRFADTFDKCKSCWGRYVCGGGCPHAHYLKTGEINMPTDDQCRSFLGMAEMKIYYNWKRSTFVVQPAEGS